MGYRFRRYGRGGRGRRFVNPMCDWFPDRPRGWWTMPQYQSPDTDMNITSPSAAARWDVEGNPMSQEAIDYEISLIQKQMEYLTKEIEYLQELKNTDN